MQISSNSKRACKTNRINHFFSFSLIFIDIETSNWANCCLEISTSIYIFANTKPIATMSSASALLLISLKIIKRHLPLMQCLQHNTTQHSALHTHIDHIRDERTNEWTNDRATDRPTDRTDLSLFVSLQ